MISKVCIVILCFTICTKADTDSNYTSCRTIEGSLCVPYYLCNNGEYTTDTDSKIDICWDISECNSLETCCKPENITVTNQL